MANEYVELLKICVSLLLLVAVGAWSKYRGLVVLDPLNRFVFHAALPCVAFRLLAIQDFFDLDWDFVAAFLMLRVTCVLLSAAYTYAADGKGTGEFLTTLIASSWMSPVVYGIPILLELYSPKEVGVLPVLASLSSIFFQLPFMLGCYEYGAVDAARKTRAREVRAAASAADHAQPLRATVARVVASLDDVEAGEGPPPAPAAPGPVAHVPTEHEAVPGRTRVAHSGWHYVAARLGKNSVLWGCVLGLVWSLTGWEIPQTIDNTLLFLAQCTSPVAMFAVGVFLFDVWTQWQSTRKLDRGEWTRVAFYLFNKFVIVTLLGAMWLHAMGVEGVKARAGVIIASLPVSVVAFTLSKQYGVHEEAVSGVIVVGTALMCPMLLIVLAIANGLF